MTERGALVDKCDRCGAWLAKMEASQHRAVEAVYAELAEQLDWPRGSGLKRTPWQWHQLMLAAFAEEQGWKPEFLPALNGTGFVMATRMKQSRLTRKQGQELKHFVRSWAIDNGVVLRDPAYDEAPPMGAYT